MAINGWSMDIIPLVGIQNSYTLTFMDDTRLSMAPPDILGQNGQTLDLNDANSFTNLCN